jgi:lysophospholipid acyltransferase (LPLAT)-like uncharacterized protein
MVEPLNRFCYADFKLPGGRHVLKIKNQWLNERWPIWAAKILWFLSRLVRTRVVAFERTKAYDPVTYAHWHGDELALIAHFGKLGTTVLVSHSRDGDYMAKAANWLGYRVMRGSSSRGAVGGLVSLIRSVKQGHDAVLAVDGPQGPRFVCKPGIIRLAQKTGAPLFPVGVAVTDKFVFKKTWNQVYLPLPFSKRVVYFGPPIFFHKKTDDQDMDAQCRRVEDALFNAHLQAEELLKTWR